MFDSSVARGEPASFPLDRVIPGWTEGLQLMKVHERGEDKYINLVIPSWIGDFDHRAQRRTSGQSSQRRPSP